MDEKDTTGDAAVEGEGVTADTDLAPDNTLPADLPADDSDIDTDPSLSDDQKAQVKNERAAQRQAAKEEAASDRADAKAERASDREDAAKERAEDKAER
jgi:hypothetical protein